MPSREASEDPRPPLAPAFPIPAVLEPIIRNSFVKNATLILYGATSFLGSALLFSVEPMIGKMALPLFGGTPAVWNTCLVYFQVLLLVGYLLSGNITTARESEPRVVSGFYLVALALLLILAIAGLPIRLSPGTSEFAAMRGRPALDLLAVLWISSALPLILVSATAPLVQRLVRGDRASPGP